MSNKVGDDLRDNAGLKERHDAVNSIFDSARLLIKGDAVGVGLGKKVGEGDGGVELITPDGIIVGFADGSAVPVGAKILVIAKSVQLPVTTVFNVLNRLPENIAEPASLMEIPVTFYGR